MSKTQKILVLNSGSSSVKYQLIQFPDEVTYLKGKVDDIGEHHASHQVETLITDKFVRESENVNVTDHGAAFREVLRVVAGYLKNDLSQIAVIGHRVVHGGAKFVQPEVITDGAIEQLKQLTYLAPQHIPNNLLAMRICQQLCPEVVQVAVFDTAFHASLPEYAYRYPIPEAWYQDYGIRRYGFHGTSHQYVSQQLAKYLARSVNSLNIISIHIGNGISACAIEQGRSIDISMGFTPLEGLMMGTRSGDIDPAIPLLIQQLANLSAQEVEEQLNFASGLEAIAGEHDMLTLLEKEQQGDKKVALALAMYVHRLRKSVGAYVAILGRVDALIFTGGIGENSAVLRQRVCENLSVLGLHLDEYHNWQPRDELLSQINSGDSLTEIFVVKTNEELQIAQQVFQVVQAVQAIEHK